MFLGKEKDGCGTLFLLLCQGQNYITSQDKNKLIIGLALHINICRVSQAVSLKLIHVLIKFFEYLGSSELVSNVPAFVPKTKLYYQPGQEQINHRTSIERALHIKIWQVSLVVISKSICEGEKLFRLS